MLLRPITRQCALNELKTKSSSTALLSYARYFATVYTNWGTLLNGALVIRVVNIIETKVTILDVSLNFSHLFPEIQTILDVSKVNRTLKLCGMLLSLSATFTS